MLHVLDDLGAAPPPPAHDCAIVTLCVGDEFRTQWARLCQANWQAYAARHGYDIIQIVTPLDTSPAAAARSPAWQKCLVADQPFAAGYARMVWLDADVLVAAHAPDILATVPDPSRIGVCLSGAQLSAAERHIYLERFHGLTVPPDHADRLWSMHIGNQFASAGLPHDAAPMCNTGVLTLSPAHHADLLRACYAHHGPEGGLYEQPALSLAIHQAGVAAPLSARFNWNVHEAMVLRFAGIPPVPATPRAVQDVVTFVMDEMRNAYLLHFAGCAPLLRLLTDLRGALPAPSPLPSSAAAPPPAAIEAAEPIPATAA